MVFNSFQFLWFFIIVYALYLKLGLRGQNRLLLMASCYFYMAFIPIYLAVLGFTIVVDYYAAFLIEREGGQRRRWMLGLSLAANLGVLFVFKYFNFANANASALASWLGWHYPLRALQIALPIGLSFHTFQAMSYTIEVYRGRQKPEADFENYALYVMFFPQLVAGPIERAGHLLPQFRSPRAITADKIQRGFYLIAWGLFQKVVVADNLAKIVDAVFSDPAPYNGPRVLLAMYAFALQIYCDFAGYSDMARGLAACMGFDLMANFARPYFACNPREFWGRWHISLSQWLRDYLYIPLGGNRGGTFATYRNLLLTMFLGGLWHGAAWTYVVWGAYHGLLLIAHRLTEAPMQAAERLLKLDRADPSGWIRRALKAAVFFHLVCIGWIFFRASSLTQAVRMLESFASSFHLIRGSDISRFVLRLVVFGTPVIMIGALQERLNDEWAAFRLPVMARATLYAIGVFYLALYSLTGGKEFIYFQF